MRSIFLWVTATIFAPLLCCEPTLGQQGTPCTPVNQRTQEVGCWILANEPIGQLTKVSVVWYLDTYANRAAAEADKGLHGTVTESLGQIWLMTVDEPGRKPPAQGKRVSEIGPLAINAGEKYSVQYMEAIFTPGMTAPAHTHGGPEAWYTLAGETCLETSDGKVQVGRAGGPPVIVPTGLSMHLTATGTETRKSLVLILYESSKPTTTFVHDWTPKGLCSKKE
jgi:quercetin dioxygenase-like cupin family protein